MLASARKIEKTKRNIWLADLVDVAGVPQYQSKYQTELRNYFLQLAFPEMQSKAKSGAALDSADPETGALIASILAQKKRAEGHG